MHRISWYWRLAAIIALFIVFGFLGYLTRTPKLSPTEVDNSAQEYRERIGNEYGQDAYNRLREKYGDQ